METKELMAQNVQDPAQAGEVLLQPPKRPKNCLLYTSRCV